MHRSVVTEPNVHPKFSYPLSKSKTIKNPTTIHSTSNSLKFRIEGLKKGGRGTSRRERIGTFLLSSVEMKIAAMIFKESPENGGETNSPATTAFSPPNRENLRQWFYDSLNRFITG